MGWRSFDVNKDSTYFHHCTFSMIHFSNNTIISTGNLYGRLVRLNFTQAIKRFDTIPNTKRIRERESGKWDGDKKFMNMKKERQQAGIGIYL